jgi:hypothetical protein
LKRANKLRLGAGLLIGQRGYKGQRALTVALLLLFLALTPLHPAASKPKPDPNGLSVEPIEIEARTIDHFDKSRPGRRRFGKLEWRGGLVLGSPSSNFGGWSGLAIDPDGRRFVAVSDAGTWLTAEIVYSGIRPTAVRGARIGPLRAVRAGAFVRERDRDAEAVSLAGGTVGRGSLLVSFERNHRIGRFKIGEHGVSAPHGYLKLPADARRMDKNLGFEAATALRGGRLKGSIIALSERFPDGRGHHTGWLWVDGVAQKLHLTDAGGFDITDAAALPDGALLVLERRFRWTEGVKMRLRLLKAGAIAPGAVMEGESLLEANMGYEIDNMEGLAIHLGPKGETVLTLISDDNFNHLVQRTILLQFTLLDNGLADARPPR